VGSPFSVDIGEGINVELTRWDSRCGLLMVSDVQLDEAAFTKILLDIYSHKHPGLPLEASRRTVPRGSEHVDT
jgi:hypothetical protein